MILYLDGSREHHDVIQEEYGVWCGGIWNRCATQVPDCAPKHLPLICVYICVCIMYVCVCLILLSFFFQ